MKRLVVGGAVLALGLGTLGTSFAGTADGQGAQKRGLFPESGSNGGICDSHAPAAGETPNGFVILNAPGKLGSTDRVIGEVSLKRGTPNQTFAVSLAQGGTCTSLTTLTTNNQGNGNAHIDGAGTGGEYYVVLQNVQQTEEKYASAPATVQ